MNTARLHRTLISLLPLLLVACTSITHPAATERKERAQKAQALFQERCKTAGEKIYRTADNVEGLLLMKLRPSEINYGDQYRLDDPYGKDYTNEGYIMSFLQGFYTPPKNPTPFTPHRIGYLYVEAIDPKDSKRYRYTGRIKSVGKKDAKAPNIQLELIRNPNYDLNIYAFVLDKVPATSPSPRYGVTYDDISTLEERDYWIAGSSLRVIDLKTNEVMAERIGYMMDPGQGDHGGGRSPWLLAASHACPQFPGNAGSSSQAGQANLFTQSVLKPKLKD